MSTVEIKMTIKVKDLTDFMTSLQSGIVEFSKETESTVVRAEVTEK